MVQNLPGNLYYCDVISRSAEKSRRIDSDFFHHFFCVPFLSLLGHGINFPDAIHDLDEIPFSFCLAAARYEVNLIQIKANKRVHLYSIVMKMKKVWLEEVNDG